MQNKQSDHINLPLILTKLNAPTDHIRLVLRPRLIDKLTDSINHRVMLIQAPAGFGKTSLAMQWRDYLITQNYRVAWLSLDAQDNDATRCINYIVSAIHSVEKSIEVNTTALSENQSSRAIYSILTDLVNQLELFNEPMYLFLDDWHFISNQATQDALNFIIECAPNHFHLIICSRTQPPLPIHTLRVKNQLSIIDSNELRFDENETYDFLSSSNKVTLKPKDIHRLWLKTEGWIASLQLILLILKRQKKKSDFISLFDDIDNIYSINEYFAENVLNSLPTDTLGFLLQTSILERFNADLCNTVTERKDSQSLLESLYKQGVFLKPLDQEQCWFQYHHLFAEFLQRHLEQKMPTKVKKLHLSASRWFADHDHTDEAVHHAIAAKEMHLAIHLVEVDSMWLVEHSFMGILLRLIDKLPESDIRMHCELQLAIAWAHCLTHHPQKAQHALNLVEMALLHKPYTNQANIRIEARVLQACVHMYADRLDKTDKILPTNFAKEDNHNPWVVVVANNIKTYVLIHNYQFEAALKLQNLSGRYHQQTRGPFSVVYGNCFAGIAHLKQCELTTAKQYFMKAQKQAWDKAGKHSHAAYLAGALLGQIYYERNELEEAGALLTDSLALGAEGGVANFYIATYCFSSRLAIIKGDFLKAYSILDKGQQVADTLGIPRLEFLLKAELVKAYILQGKIQSAQHVMQQWNKMVIPNRASSIVDHLFEIRFSSEARLFCRTGDYDKAITILRTILTDNMAKKRYYYEMSTRTLLSKTLNKSGRNKEAEDILWPALVRGHEQGMVRVFIDEGWDILKVIERLAKQCQLECTKCDTANFNIWLGSLVDLFQQEQTEKKNKIVMIRDIKERVKPDIDSLKEKEVLILKMLEKGLSNKEIARNLNVGVNTVKWYLKAIYIKLGVSRRAQAVIEARNLDLLN